MDFELIHKPGRDNLVSDVLSRIYELISPRLFMLVKDNLDEVEKDFLNNVTEAMKHDENAMTNNRFFNERDLKKILHEANEWRTWDVRTNSTTSNKRGYMSITTYDSCDSYMYYSTQYVYYWKR